MKNEIGLSINFSLLVHPPYPTRAPRHARLPHLFPHARLLVEAKPRPHKNVLANEGSHIPIHANHHL